MVGNNCLVLKIKQLYKYHTRSRMADLLSSSDIKIIVTEIRSCVVENPVEKKTFFEKKYPEFATNCPRLFEGALDEKFPIQFLDMILRHRDSLMKQVANGSANREESDQAVVKLLTQEFIDPLTATTTSPSS